MDKIFNWACAMMGIFGGILANLFGAWDAVLYTLVVLIVLDYVTGVIKAIYKKTLSSEVGFKGLLKKIIILIIVAAANSVQGLLSDSIAIREIVIMFFISNEGISLLENSAELIPIPLALKNVLVQLRNNKGDSLGGE